MCQHRCVHYRVGCRKLQCSSNSFVNSVFIFCDAAAFPSFNLQLSSQLLPEQRGLAVVFEMLNTFARSEKDQQAVSGYISTNIFTVKSRKVNCNEEKLW